MCFSQLVGLIAHPSRLWPKRHAPTKQKRVARVRPSTKPRVFEVIPVRLGRTDYYFYHVRNQLTGHVVKRTANYALAEITALQCQRDYEAEQTAIRTAANHLGIEQFQARQRVA